MRRDRHAGAPQRTGDRGMGVGLVRIEWPPQAERRERLREMHRLAGTDP